MSDREIEQGGEAEISEEQVIAEVLVTFVGFIVDALLILAAVLGFSGGIQGPLNFISFLPLMFTLTQLHYLLSTRGFVFNDGQVYEIAVRPFVFNECRGSPFTSRQGREESMENHWVEWCFANIAIVQLAELLILTTLIGSALTVESPDILFITVAGLDTLLNVGKAFRFCDKTNCRQLVNSFDGALVYQVPIATVLSPATLFFLLQVLCYATLDWPKVRKSVCCQSTEEILEVVA